MFGRRRAAPVSADAAPAAAPLTADELVVRVAEAVVGQAWAVELTWRHDKAADDLHAAEALCEAARQRVEAAQRTGDPRRISLAHAHLERALVILRESDVACDQIHTAVNTELRLLARTTGQRALAELVDQWEAETLAPQLQSPDPLAAAAEQAPDEVPRRRSWRRLWRVPGRLLGLFAGRTTLLQQP
jgi:hypothetical protein